MFAVLTLDDLARRFATAFRSLPGQSGPLQKRHPQRTMLAAHHLWQLTPPGGVADTAMWADAQNAILDAVRDELVAIHVTLLGPDVQ